MDNEFINVDDDKKKEKILEAKSYIDYGLKMNQKNAVETSLLYYRALLQFYLHQFFEALLDIEAV
jgi:hypothetical protein